jgi:cytochrome c oxidase cbb3-type subunit 3
MADKNNHKKEIDKISGVETTGHEWDGLQELNNPAPRWWLIVFIVCCVWAFGYWIVYPAWPTFKDHTKGAFGWTEYKKLEKDQVAINSRKRRFLDQIEKMTVEQIRNTPEIFEFSVAAGEALFKDNCATCHQVGGAGAKGYPNLNDDEWIWGGTLAEIKQTITHGIRSKDEVAHNSAMPSFGKDGILTKEDISKVANYVMSMQGKNSNKDAEYLKSGSEIFANNCASCHGDKGLGNKDFGAPNLANAISLKAATQEEVFSQIWNAKMGMMPNWSERLTEEQIKLLTIYVHSLGGRQ